MNLQFPHEKKCIEFINGFCEGVLKLLLFYVHTESLFLTIDGVLRWSFNSGKLCANKQSTCWLIIRITFFLFIYEEHLNQNDRQSD